MDRSKTMGLFISTSLIAAILGAITGLVWSYALGHSIQSGLLYGGICGVVAGFLLFLSQSGSHKESASKSGGLTTMLFMISTIIAIVVGLVRWLL